MAMLVWDSTIGADLHHVVQVRKSEKELEPINGIGA